MTCEIKPKKFIIINFLEEQNKNLNSIYINIKYAEVGNFVSANFYQIKNLLFQLLIQ